MTLTPGSPCTSRHCSCHFRHRTLPEVSPSCSLPSRHSPRAGTGPCLEYIWAGWTFLMLDTLADAVAEFACLCWISLQLCFWIKLMLSCWAYLLMLDSLAYAGLGCWRCFWIETDAGLTCWCCRWTHVLMLDNLMILDTSCVLNRCHCSSFPHFLCCCWTKLLTLTDNFPSYFRYFISSRNLINFGN